MLQRLFAFGLAHRLPNACHPPALRILWVFPSRTGTCNGRDRVLILETASVGTADINSFDDTYTVFILLGDLAKNDVLAIEPRGHDSGDEKLGAIGVGASIGHGEEVRLVVGELEVFIGKLLPIYRFATGSLCTVRVSNDAPPSDNVRDWGGVLHVARKL